jgi:MoaA/NifB/PqqE/SkfB family radical SAM enzyme
MFMHAATYVRRDETAETVPPLDFVWLELTNQCNLQCRHCYSESSPYSTTKNLLNESGYANLIAEAYELGCRQIQFIGGEPTLNKSLPYLIAHADSCGYQFIEVFSNLVSLSAPLLNVFVEHRVAVATSVYASAPSLHDLITQTPGSHEKTIRNIKRVLDSGLTLRVGVIAMGENAPEIDSTFAFLRELGVRNISLDHVRGFGRAQAQNTCSMESLCGNCANNILAIGPDGIVAPCIMSKQWAVGSVLNKPLREIALSESLAQTRRRIGAATVSKVQSWGPNPCGPDASCSPNCAPNTNCGPCSPYANQPCQPTRWCNPTK